MADDDSSDHEDQADGATGAGTGAVQGTPESSTPSSGEKAAPGASRDRPHESGYGGRSGESKSTSNAPRDGVRLPKNPGV